MSITWHGAHRNAPPHDIPMNSPIRTVLFDLDGTLADTAPDMAFALNVVREEIGLTALPFSQIRSRVSHGATALVQLALDEPHSERFATLRTRFLEVYRNHLTRETRLFPGMEEVLHHIEQCGMKWGVVTNKPAWLTEPLLDQLHLTQRAACIVSGDTTSERKPHPAPMLYACKKTGSHGSCCLYIGDAQRDVEAGKNAGMHTLVALFGYIDPTDQPHLWNADAMIHHPREIIEWIAARSV